MNSAWWAARKNNATDRLLYEFKQQLGQEGARYVKGTCFTYGESISYPPFPPFLDIVRTLCGLEEDGDAAAAAKR